MTVATVVCTVVVTISVLQADGKPQALKFTPSKARGCPPHMIVTLRTRLAPRRELPNVCYRPIEPLLRWP